VLSVGATDRANGLPLYGPRFGMPVTLDLLFSVGKRRLCDFGDDMIDIGEAIVDVRGLMPNRVSTEIHITSAQAQVLITAVQQNCRHMYSISDGVVPEPLRSGLRGVGQVFFQENALTGACFVVGIALSSPLMAAGAVAGSAIGTATAYGLKFDKGEQAAGIYGFNSALVGIATFFFFRPSALSFAMLVGGCVVAAVVTWLMRRNLPFPTYTTPFIVTTWALFFLGQGLGIERAASGGPLVGVGFGGAVAHGVSQVMFQASIWTALFFLVGIALNDWRHASWVLLGSIVGTLVGYYQSASWAGTVDPESLVDRGLPENVALGLYGYNATLTAVALFLWRRSFIPPLLGMLLSVPITDLVPMVGLPALTAPFVLATWIVLAFGWLDRKLWPEQAPVAA
jgi:urea transporter